MITCARENDINWVKISDYRRPLIYLDHCALRYFSSNIESRKRFLSFFRIKGTLCFSWMNFYDIGGNDIGQSLDDIKIFMDGVGNNWIPIHFNPHKVMESEEASVPIPFIDGSIIKSYYPFIHGGSLTPNRAVDLAGSSEVRNVLLKNVSNMQDLRKDINIYINDSGGKARGERIFQETTFDSSRPIMFVYHKLFSLLLKQRQPLSNNDIIDLFHAVVSLSYSDMVVLDGGWADRARQISIPLGRVKCYSVKKKELEQFQKDFEKF